MPPLFFPHKNRLLQAHNDEIARLARELIRLGVPFNAGHLELPEANPKVPITCELGECDLVYRIGKQWFCVKVVCLEGNPPGWSD